MKIDLTGKKAIVTGSTKGIGLATAKGLAEAHMIVYTCSEQASATSGASLRVEGGVVDSL